MFQSFLVLGLEEIYREGLGVCYGIALPYYVINTAPKQICKSAFCIVFTKYDTFDFLNGRMFLIMTGAYAAIIKKELEAAPNRLMIGSSYRTIFNNLPEMNGLTTINDGQPKLTNEALFFLNDFNVFRKNSMCCAIKEAMNYKFNMMDKFLQILVGGDNNILSALLTSRELWGDGLYGPLK